MTDMRGDWSLSPSFVLEAHPHPSLPVSPVLRSGVETDPKKQRPKRTTKVRSTTTMPPPSLQGTSSSPKRSTPSHIMEDPLPPTTSTPQGNWPGPPTDLGNQDPRRTPLPASPSSGSDLDEDDIISLLEECQELTVTTGMTKTPLPKHTVQSQIDFSRVATDKGDRITPIHTPTHRPIRHINTTHKIKNWSLAVKEKWLILGDWNVARFPPFKIANLQIDGFPGATFRHIRGVLAKIEPTYTVEKVILSFGINNRTIMAQTAIKELQRLHRTASIKFPFPIPSRHLDSCDQLL